MFLAQFFDEFYTFSTLFEILYQFTRYCVDPKVSLRGGLQVLLDKYLPLEQNKEMISILGQLSIACTKKCRGRKKRDFLEIFPRG